MSDERLSPTHLAARFRHLVETRDVAGPTDDPVAEEIIQAVERGETVSQQVFAQLKRRITTERPAAPIAANGTAKIGRRAMEIFPDWPRFHAQAQHLVASIARIDRRAEAQATAFLVGPTHVLTNRHVAEGLGLSPGQPAREITAKFPGRSSATRIPISTVADLSDEADLALLMLSRPVDLPPLQLSPPASPALDDALVTIGYPDAGPYGDFAGLFHGKYGIERASPGRVCRLETTTFLHDCSTLGGNSGSPIFEQSTGDVVGIQTEGSFLELNTAVTAEAAATFLIKTLPPAESATCTS